MGDKGQNNSFAGVIKAYHSARGFGFIAPDDGGEDLFFHVYDVRIDGGPKIGKQVAFDRVINPKNGRWRAFEVHEL